VVIVVPVVPVLQKAENGIFNVWSTGEDFRLFDFVRVSCMVHVSVKNLKTLKISEDLPQQNLHPCFGLIVGMSVMTLKTLKTFMMYYSLV
jgi:hypothetical protein